MGTSKVINLIIVDPDPSMRSRWRAAFGVGTGFHILGEGPGVLNAWPSGAALEHRPDVLLIHADHFPGPDTRSWAILRGFVDPQVHIVAVTKGESDEPLEFLLAIGVMGLCPPTAALSTLRRVVRNAATGTVDYDPVLLERVRALLAGTGMSGKVRFGPLMIDLERRVVSLWGDSVPLTNLEFDVLAYLAHSGGRRVSSAELLERVWGAPLGAGGTLDQVKACVRRLRKKIEADPKHPLCLLTARGEGYFLSGRQEGIDTPSS